MTTLGEELTAVLDRLADLLAQVGPDQYGLPTPCPDYDVAALRSHVLGWAGFFVAAFEDAPERPSADDYVAPAEPGAAAAEMRRLARRAQAAVEGGAAERQISLFGDSMPGLVPLNMCLGEYLVHGNDLALATGLPWEPPAGALALALGFLPEMLTDDYRGPDKSFGYPVEVPESASDLEKLVAFTGRDPYWKP